VISGEGYSLTPELTLYGPDGTAIDSGSGYGTADVVVAGTTDAEDGTYYLKATPSDVAGEPYGFAVETVDPDGFEANDDRGGALPVEPGEGVQGTIPDGDADWFAIEASSGERLDATVSIPEAIGVDNNVALTLYDPEGNEIGENPEDVRTNNAPADRTSRFDSRFAVTQTAATEESGTYYVRVTGVETTGFTEYDLVTAVSETDGDNGNDDNGDDGNDGENGTDDGDDVRANATPIEPNEFVEGEIDAGGGDGRDIDWYRFDVAAGEHLRVVSAEGYGVGSAFTLYGPSGDVLGSGEEFGTEDAPVAGATDAAGGTYYLKVTIDDTFAGEPYGFSVETTPPDPFEPNEKRSEAVPIDSGTTRSGVIAAGDGDWFAVDVAAGETLNTTLELTDARSLGYVGRNNADLDLYDPDGDEVGRNRNDVRTNNAPADQTSRFDGRFAVTQTAVAEETGTYYVRVTGVETTGFTEYDLVTAVSGTDDDGDDGENETGDGGDDEGGNDGENGDGSGSGPYDNATAVDSLSAIENGEIGSDGEAAVFAVELTEGSQVEITQGIGGGAFPVTLLDRDGNVLGRLADQDEYRSEEYTLRANASYTGAYYLKVDGEPGDRYSILETVTEPDDSEPNDARTEATVLAIGGSEEATVVRGDTDYYAVDPSAGETVEVFANGTGAAELTVYGPDGSVIETAKVPYGSSPNAGDPIASATAENGGTYYLELSIQENTTGNVNSEYTLELERANGTDNGEPSGGDTDESDDGTTETTASDGGDDSETTSADSTTDATPASDGTDDNASAPPDGTETADNTDSIDSTDTAADTTATGTTSNADTIGDAATETGDSSDETGDSTTGTGTTETSATDETTGGAATSGGAERTAVDGPGFGLLAALLALLALCGLGLFALRRN
jgi:hypothetical protein